MARTIADKPVLMIEHGETAEAALGAVDETIGSMTKTAVILWLETYFYGRNSWKKDIPTIKSKTCEGGTEDV